jgi:hypothetical protein
VTPARRPSEAEAGSSRPAGAEWREAARQLRQTLQQVERRMAEPDIRVRQARAVQQFRQADADLEESRRQVEAVFQESSRLAEALWLDTCQSRAAAVASLSELDIELPPAAPTPQLSSEAAADVLAGLRELSVAAREGASEITARADAIQAVRQTDAVLGAAEQTFSQLHDAQGLKRCRSARSELMSFEEATPPSGFGEVRRYEAEVRVVSHQLGQYVLTRLADLRAAYDPGKDPPKLGWETVGWILAGWVVLFIAVLGLGGDLLNALVDHGQVSESAKEPIAWAIVVVASLLAAAHFVYLVMAHPFRLTSYRRRKAASEEAERAEERFRQHLHLPASTGLSHEERLARLSRIIWIRTRSGWNVVAENEPDVWAVLHLPGKRVNHTLHALVTVFTVWWGLVWLIMYFRRQKEQQVRVSIDGYGNVLEDQITPT